MKKLLFLLPVLTLLAACHLFLKPLEGEGYKGIPWGTKLNLFRQYKGQDAASRTRYQLSDFVQCKGDYASGKDEPYELTWIGEFFQGLVEGFKIQRFKKDENEFIDQDLMPDRFSSIYIKEDDTVFCFYKGQLFAGMTPIDESSFRAVRQELDKKYGNWQDFIHDFGQWKQDEDDSSKYSGRTYTFNGAQYSKGKNTNIYLVETLLDADTEKDPLKYYGLYYVCKSCLMPIQEDYRNAVANQVANAAWWEKHKDDPLPVNTPTDTEKESNIRKVE